MDKIITMLLGALLCVSTGSYANEIKIGFVSTERLFREAAPAVRALKKLEKEFAPRDAELQKLAKQAKDLQTQLEKEGMTMSESDRRAKEADLGRMNRDLQRMQREFREDLNLRKNEELRRCWSVRIKSSSRSPRLKNWTWCCRRRSIAAPGST